MFVICRTDSTMHMHIDLCVPQIVEEDVEGYVSVVEGLGEEAKKLVRADHFDSVNITARQVHNCVAMSTLGGYG